MQRDARIAIVGGSLVGPTTKLYLEAAGFEDVTIYEASRVVHPTSGGVMGVRPDVVFDLGNLGVDTGKLAALKTSMVTSHDVVAGMPRRRGATMFPGLTASWDTLRGQLGNLTEAQHGKRLVAIRGTTNGTEIEFADGETREVDLVIGADGRKSTVRKLMDPARDSQFAYQGYLTWRGLTPQRPNGWGEISGFHRVYDAPHGSLFSLTEPLVQSGLQYFEYSHNLPRWSFRDMAGEMPEDKAYLLPKDVGSVARGVLETAMDELSLPLALRDAVRSAVSLTAIPVNDLPAPLQVHWQVGGGHVVILGDAVLPVRLQVGVGLNMGIKQARGLTAALAGGHTLTGWERHAINRLLPWAELGRSRAARINLGPYWPIRPGRTAVPSSGPFTQPRWVSA